MVKLANYWVVVAATLLAPWAQGCGRGAPLADLPLTVVAAAPGTHSPWFGIFLSGGGGWRGIDRRIGHSLAARGIPVVGWNSLKYFWSPRTPEGASLDLSRVIRHYSRLWGKSRVVLIGYSQGADTLPFMVNRLPASIHGLVGLTALIGFGDRAAFEFRLASLLSVRRDVLPTAPELDHWRGSPYLCLYGRKDHEASCADLKGPWLTSIEMPGGHHFDGHYQAIADRILAHLPAPP
ncbi:MAG: hypothetical protein HKM03_06595 [Steroidobacteraceae bacterium]|nr:hypothetical protein [Steroidobacteraceae bacterium]